MEQPQSSLRARHMYVHGLFSICILAAACSTPSKSGEGATADALTVEDTNGADTLRATADATQLDATLDAADSEDITTLPPTCSGSGSALTCSGSPTPDGVFILHGASETPTFLPFAATLSTKSAVVLVGRGAVDHQIPLINSIRTTGMLHDGAVKLRLHAPVITTAEKKWLVGKFGESPKAVIRVGPAHETVFMSCMDGFHTMDETIRAYPCWAEWLPDPVAAPIWSLFHVGKDSFDLEKTTNGLLTFGTVAVSTSDESKNDNVSIMLEYNSGGWSDSLKGFWAQEDESDNAYADRAALVALNPTSGTKIIRNLNDFGASFPTAARVTKKQLTYVSGLDDAKMVAVDLNTGKVKESALPGGISRVPVGQWFKGRFYLLVRKEEMGGGHVVALRPNNTLAWSTLLPNTKPGSTGYKALRGFDVTDHGIVLTWSLPSSGVPDTKAVLHFHTLIYALDLNGKLLWSRAVGPLEHKYLSNFALWLPNGHVLTGGRVWRPGYSRLYQGFMAVFDKKGELVPWNKAWPKP